MKAHNLIFNSIVIILFISCIVVLTGFSVDIERPQANIYTKSGLNYSATPHYDINTYKNVTVIDLNDVYGDKLEFNEYLYGKYFATKEHGYALQMKIHSSSFIKNGKIKDDDVIEISFFSPIVHGGNYKIPYGEMKERFSILLMFDRSLFTNEFKYEYQTATYQIEDIIDLVRADMHPRMYLIENSEHIDELQGFAEIKDIKIYMMNGTEIPMNTWVYFVIDEKNETVSYVIKE